MPIFQGFSAPTMWIFKRLSREKPPPRWGGAGRAGGGYYRGSRETPTEVGRCQSTVYDGTLGARSTPTEVGRWLRVARSLYRVGDLVRETPTEVGRCLRGQVTDRRHQHHIDRETPTEVGVLCETLASTASMSTEKPPPKWVHRHLPPNCQGSCHHYSTQL